MRWATNIGPVSLAPATKRHPTLVPPSRHAALAGVCIASLIKSLSIPGTPLDGHSDQTVTAPPNTGRALDSGTNWCRTFKRNGQAFTSERLTPPQAPAQKIDNLAAACEPDNGLQKQPAHDNRAYVA